MDPDFFLNSGNELSCGDLFFCGRMLTKLIKVFTVKNFQWDKNIYILFVSILKTRPQKWTSGTSIPSCQMTYIHLRRDTQTYAWTVLSLSVCPSLISTDPFKNLPRRDAVSVKHPIITLSFYASSLTPQMPWSLGVASTSVSCDSRVALTTAAGRSEYSYRTSVYI